MERRVGNHANLDYTFEGGVLTLTAMNTDVKTHAEVVCRHYPHELVL